MDRSSTFFGSPTSHLFRTKSPWRRTLQEAMEKANTLSEEPPVNSNETIAATSTTTEAADKKAVTDSASNYSQDTQVYNSATDHNSSVAGRPLVVEATTTYRPTGERLASTASSVDWKTRLSFEVERAEDWLPSPTRVSGRASEVEYVVPTMPRAFGQGHVREAAQIGPYEEDEHRSTTPAVRMPTNPTTPLSSVEPNINKLTPQQRSVMQTTPPSAGPLQKSVLPISKTTGSLGGDMPSFVASRDAMRPRASPLDSNTGSCEEEAGKGNISQLKTPGQENVVEVRQAKSLAHVKSYSGLCSEETGSPLRHRGSPTIRLMRKQVAKLEPNSESVTSTPEFSSAFKRHFGPLASSPRRRDDVVDKENQSPTNKAWGHGSQSMVDFFLNTRRRQGASSSDGPAFV
ncbi:hypothetical protein M406DRAFT_71670 [Cryphonectria parasitica EP155]|uniref:Uncharacterized protein n=1 Tax=Cryphonectria parasitica (strain ATCC 38755 / EP155) TaxID=660469 RepID=A0A9P4Y994_CRYP1|nr:uncharacterized protein M406DRAFT_71670 [Cryphonectria parasitica EP155]KAF3768687.1 hypothetical protein M406DRAFT_71670 [Cryphonectria parasitica EP155]